MEKMIFLIAILAFAVSPLDAQYDARYAESKVVNIKNETYAIQKMLRRDNHVKVKYFAEKDGNLTVNSRYENWAAGKKVIAISSGTYMTTCDVNTAKPVGLCIDNGRVVNRVLGDMDGLMIVYATGGLAASNLKNGNLTITDAKGGKKVLDIRNNGYHLAEFIAWAEEMEATVFQTHLFVYDNKMSIGGNSSSTTAPRRFLAVCKNDNNEIIHYIVNLPSASTLLDGTKKAYDYLNNYEDVSVVFMINLDTGCQNVFRVNDKDGNTSTSKNFRGDVDPSSAANLLVYYYE